MIFFSLFFSRNYFLARDCFILGSFQATPFLTRRLWMCKRDRAKSKPRLLRGRLGDGWWAGTGRARLTEAGRWKGRLHLWYWHGHILSPGNWPRPSGEEGKHRRLCGRCPGLLWLLCGPGCVRNLYHPGSTGPILRAKTTNRHRLSCSAG